MEQFKPSSHGFEPVPEPRFDIRESRDSESERNTTLHLSYGHLSFSARVDLGNGKLLSEAYPTSPNNDESSEYVERMRNLASQQAQEYAFDKMMEDFE